MTASSQPTSPAGISINWRSDVAVVVCLAVALVAGWFFKGAVQGQRQTIEDPLTGFLYPDDATGRGAGSFSYIVRPKAGLTPT